MRGLDRGRLDRFSVRFPGVTTVMFIRGRRLGLRIFPGARQLVRASGEAREARHGKIGLSVSVLAHQLAGARVFSFALGVGLIFGPREIAAFCFASATILPLVGTLF